MTRWLIADAPELNQNQITAANQSPLLARLLAQRGIVCPEAIQRFLAPLDAPAVSGLELPGMDVAVRRVLRAIEEDEPILVYGDFDVDGITGTSVLMETLSYLNAKVSFYIPDRAKEGHGLHTASLCRLISSRQIKLVISTDTGITNYNEVCLLNNLGVATIITDHHELGEALPPSVANINPRLLKDETHPLAPLAGVGVAYKLCELLLAENGAPPEIAEQLLDLVAIGTIADVAPLTLENRRLVQQGITVMNKRQRTGVEALLTQAGVAPDAPLTAETVGFVLGPRLNAVGRLEDANDAALLLITRDEAEARRLASQMEALNRRRRELCEKTTREAEQFLRQSGVTIGPNETDTKAIVLASPDWHLGVIGIVASRLVDSYHVPVFLMVHDTQANTLRCSARSIKGFPLVEALEPLRHFFTVFGGHAMAGGFTLPYDKFNTFRTALYAVADQWMKPEMMVDELAIDATLQLSEVTPALVEHLQVLEPTGQANRPPILAVMGATVSASRLLNDSHLKLVLTDPDHPRAEPLEALYWRLGDKPAPEPGDKVDVAGCVGLNRYNGTERVQMILDDFRLGQAAGSARPKQKAVSTHNGFLPQAPVPSVSQAPAYATSPEVARLSGPPLKTLASLNDTPSGIEPASVDTPLSQSEPLSQPFWVDHRKRDQVDQYIGLLLQETDRDRVVYHEGREPNIPYLTPRQWVGRQSLRQADEVIFWDLPPDADSLQQIMAVTRPRVIHWVGGKYQTVPLQPNASDYLKAMLGVFNRLPRTEAHIVTHLASQLATSTHVVLTGLSLLQQLGYLTADIERQPETAVQLTMLPRNGQPSVNQYPLALETFHHSLQHVVKYRHWLLSSSGQVLQPLLTLYGQQPAEGITTAVGP